MNVDPWSKLKAARLINEAEDDTKLGGNVDTAQIKAVLAIAAALTYVGDELNSLVQVIKKPRA